VGKDALDEIGRDCTISVAVFGGGFGTDWGDPPGMVLSVTDAIGEGMLLDTVAGIAPRDFSTVTALLISYVH